MPARSRLSIAKQDILSLFSSASQKIYGRKELARVLLQNRRSWHLAAYTNLADFISFLMRQGDLQAHKLRSKSSTTEITRYSWGTASPLELATSLKAGAYVCHSTAAALHGLADLNPNIIYLNAEQSIKPAGDRSLTQDAIDRAFSAQQRQSNLVYKYRNTSIVITSGKNSNCLGVEKIIGPTSETIRVTDLERTLIDIVVRPTYAGGSARIIEAYRAARNRVSVAKLLDVLKKLNYAYPYHQPIGFLMQTTGYPKEAYSQMRSIKMAYDFYLDHRIQQREYCSDWRLYYPKELQSQLLL